MDQTTPKPDQPTDAQAPQMPQGRPANVPANAIFVSIRNREKLMYNDIARAVSSTNEKGKFDVLGQHTNFISMIKDFIVIRKMDGTKIEMKITNGIMQVTPKGCTVFMGILDENPTELPDQKDKQTAPPQDKKK